MSLFDSYQRLTVWLDTFGQNKTEEFQADLRAVLEAVRQQAIDDEAFEGMKEGAAERIADLESKLLLICAAIGDWNTHGAHTPCGCAVCAELSDIARKELQ